MSSTGIVRPLCISDTVLEPTLRCWRRAYLEARKPGRARWPDAAQAVDCGVDVRVTALLSIAFALFGVHVGGERVVPFGYAPAWSGNGARLAFAARGDLWVSDADGSRRFRLVRNANDPTWSPSGRSLAFVREGSLWTVRADGLDQRRLARGRHPVWSPDGKRIAFDRDGQIFSARRSGGHLRHLVAGEEPAYARDGRLAFVRDGVVIAGKRTIGKGASPSWSPSGEHIAYTRAGHVWVNGRRIGRGADPAWRPGGTVVELLPDLEPRPPSHLRVVRHDDRWLLGFTSQADNVGLGAVAILGTRAPGMPRMTATQRVQLANGKWRAYTGAGQLRYTNSPPHRHWHLMKFDVYQLRTLSGDTAVSDRKSGFCLADHWGTAPGDYPDRRAHFLGNCKQLQPEALRVGQGTSVGFTDRYPAFFHGENVDLTHVPGGVYDLVHRANPSMLLRELRYENNVASVRLRLTWRDGVPQVRVLRRCARSVFC